MPFSQRSDPCFPFSLFGVLRSHLIDRGDSERKSEGGREGVASRLSGEKKVHRVILIIRAGDGTLRN